jgi:hypothetical protein
MTQRFPQQYQSDAVYALYILHAVRKVCTVHCILLKLNRATHAHYCLSENCIKCWRCHLEAVCCCHRQLHQYSLCRRCYHLRIRCCSAQVHGQWLLCFRDLQVCCTVHCALVCSSSIQAICSRRHLQLPAQLDKVSDSAGTSLLACSKLPANVCLALHEHLSSILTKQVRLLV